MIVDLKVCSATFGKQNNFQHLMHLNINGLELLLANLSFLTHWSFQLQLCQISVFILTHFRYLTSFRLIYLYLYKDFKLNLIDDLADNKNNMIQKNTHWVKNSSNYKKVLSEIKKIL